MLDLGCSMFNSPGGLPTIAVRDLAIQERENDLRRVLNGDFSVSRRQFETPPSITSRVGGVNWASYSATSAPSPFQREQIRIARADFVSVERDLTAFMDDLATLEARLEAEGAPYTPGRPPEHLQQAARRERPRPLSDGAGASLTPNPPSLTPVGLLRQRGVPADRLRPVQPTAASTPYHRR